MTMPGMVMSSGMQVQPSAMQPAGTRATAEFGMAGAWQMCDRMGWTGRQGFGVV